MTVRARRGLVLLALAAACAPKPSLLERAIAARGGPLPGLVREVDAEIAQGFPGTWRWRTVFALPDRYAWSLETADRPNHYLFDGTVVRAFLGDAEVSADASPEAPLRSQARFAAVTNLDALRLPGVRVAEAPPATLPAGTAAGLVAVFADRGDRYLIALDAAGLVAQVEGPIDFEPFARGTLAAALDDVRPVRGRRLAHRTRYVLNGALLAVEHLRRACPLTEPLPAIAFASPGTLPVCADRD